MLAAILGITKPLLATSAKHSKEFVSQDAMKDFTIAQQEELLKKYNVPMKDVPVEFKEASDTHIKAKSGYDTVRHMETERALETDRALMTEIEDGL